MNSHNSSTQLIKRSAGEELGVRPSSVAETPCDTQRYTTSSPATQTSSFSARQHLQVAWMQVSEPEGRASHVGSLPCANTSMKGISAKWEVNWNKSFITWNTAATFPQQRELCSLECPWVNSYHIDQPLVSDKSSPKETDCDRN